MNLFSKLFRSRDKLRDYLGGLSLTMEQPERDADIAVANPTIPVEEEDCVEEPTVLPDERDTILDYYGEMILDD